MLTRLTCQGLFVAVIAFTRQQYRSISKLATLSTRVSLQNRRTKINDLKRTSKRFSSSFTMDSGGDSRTEVCIVGAGAAGLCALRHFGARPETFSVCAYEQTRFVGGTWRYSDKVGLDDNGLPIHSSMYKNLRTNLPMQIMEYPDFKSNCTESFVAHSKVYQYLNDYCQHFNLKSLIQFSHLVKKIRREEFGWLVTVTDLERDVTSTRRFDILVICVGRYSLPYVPPYETLKLFKGKVIHSHDYRVPEQFEGQTVAVVGGGMSGVDICIELANVASQVVFINRSDPKAHFENLPPKVLQLYAQIEEFGDNSMTILDLKEKAKKQINLDAVVFTTGYLFDFDFLDDSCAIQTDGFTIDGLYRHIFNMKYPSMTFIGVMGHVLPFPLFDCQVQFVLQTVLNNVTLPPPEEMQAEMEVEQLERFKVGLKPRHRHQFTNEMLMKYMDRLYREGNFPRPRNVVFNLYKDVSDERKTDIVGYKDINYKLLSDDEYQVISETS